MYQGYQDNNEILNRQPMVLCSLVISHLAVRRLRFHVARELVFFIIAKPLAHGGERHNGNFQNCSLGLNSNIR